MTLNPTVIEWAKKIAKKGSAQGPLEEWVWDEEASSIWVGATVGNLFEPHACQILIVAGGGSWDVSCRFIAPENQSTYAHRFTIRDTNAFSRKDYGVRARVAEALDAPRRAAESRARQAESAAMLADYPEAEVEDRVTWSYAGWRVQRERPLRWSVRRGDSRSWSSWVELTDNELRGLLSGAHLDVVDQKIIALADPS